MLGQIIRFGLVGGFVTGLGASVYLVAVYAGVAPLLANFFSYLAAMGAGYFLHSRVSFKGHGSRDNPARRTFRFVVVSLVSLGLNSLFVWVLTEDSMLDGDWWWPLIPIVFVTPLVTFALNRLWVFK